MAAAPSSAHFEVSAVRTESFLLAAGGAVLASRRCERQMNRNSRTIRTAISRNDVSMLRNEASRIAAVPAAVAPPAPGPVPENSPPRSISCEPR